MKLNFGLTVLLCLFLSCVAGDVPALKKGDVLPDLPLPHMLNNGNKYVRTGSFNKGLLIIDFWRTYCVPCLRLFPEFGKLQGAFNGRVHFLLVTAEDEGRVQPVLQRLGCGLPCVCRDSTLDKLFPHNSIPHEVWLLNGKVIAFSYGEEVNAQSVAKALDGLELKDDKRDDLAFDQHRPLLANGNGSGPVLSQSIITPYLEHLRSYTGYEVADGRIVADAINTTVCALYRQAALRVDPLLGSDNRLLLEVADSLRDVLSMPKGAAAHEWLKANGYCYDLVLPAGFKGSVGRVMLDDLNRYFGCRYGIYASLEKRRLHCWVLTAGGGRSRVDSTGHPLYVADDTVYLQRALPVGSFVSLLAYEYRRLREPLIDETGLKGPVDIEVTGSRSDPRAVDGQLRLIGMRLRLKWRLIDMLVIRSVGVSKLNLKPNQIQ